MLARDRSTREAYLTRNFPGGVADPEGRRGFVGLPGGQVTALDLNSGAVIWKRAGLGQPLAANLSRLVTVHEAGGGIALRLTDAQTGRDVATVTGLDLPNWARHVIGQPDAARFHASNEAGGFRVSWWLRQPYRGGAPPGPTIAASRSAEPVTGSILLDPASGVVLAKGPWIAPADREESIPSEDPNVIAQERIGGRLYRLKAAPGNERDTEMTVEAQSAASGNVEWEAPLGAVPNTGPPPLRK